MVYEIQGCTYRDVGGFFEKHFEGRHWSRGIRGIYNAVKKQYRGEIGFPDPPTGDDVWDWLFRIQNEYLSHLHGKLNTTAFRILQSSLPLF